MSRDAARARSGASRTSLYDEITTKIIADLAAGRVPWVQPWGTAAAKAPLAIPKNASTGRFYSGINVLILWGSVIEHGFPVQSWLTFRQALGLGGNVRKGKHGTTVVYADRFIPDDEKKRAQETGEDAQAIPFLKRFTVFNLAQCEGLPENLVVPAPPPEPGLIEPKVEALIKASGIDFRIGGTRALDRLQSTTVATSLRQTSERRMHRFSWINEWTERADAHGRADGIDLIVPDWFYRAVHDEALVLTIDRAYFALTGGLERWLYRIVRKHAGRQRAGWRFEFQHLYAKSASLSPYKRFAFELRDLARRQPLPGYHLAVDRDRAGRELLAFTQGSFSTGGCEQAVDGVVLSGTAEHVPSGTAATCYREPEEAFFDGNSVTSEPPNLESNILTLTCCCEPEDYGDNASLLQSARGRLSGKDGFTYDMAFQGLPAPAGLSLCRRCGRPLPSRSP